MWPAHASLFVPGPFLRQLHFCYDSACLFCQFLLAQILTCTTSCRDSVVHWHGLGESGFCSDYSGVVPFRSRMPYIFTISFNRLAHFIVGKVGTREWCIHNSLHMQRISKLSGASERHLGGLGGLWCASGSIWGAGFGILGKKALH